ncbi:MAG: hypothetical protein FJ216_00765 [Ignavibacteria bacterium]|nr:hypothetical protein [Ignavibacteria bacterium]
MKITSIQKQKKEGRYNIYIDDEFAFGLYGDTVFKFGLRRNDELNENKIKEIRDYDEFQYGSKVAMRYLSKSARTEEEVKKRLLKEKINTSNIQKVVNQLKTLKYIDDIAYTRNFLQYRLKKNPQGRLVLEKKLKQKGVSKEIIEQSMNELYDLKTETEKLEEQLKKYLKKVKGKTLLEKKQKCWRYLMSKGYTYETISEIFPEYFS